MNKTPTINGSFTPELKEFVAQAEWTFAKTMPEWPYEYLVRGEVDEVLFEQLVHHMK